MKSSKDSGEAVELSKTIFFPASVTQASHGVPPVGCDGIYLASYIFNKI